VALSKTTTNDDNASEYAQHITTYGNKEVQAS